MNQKTIIGIVVAIVLAVGGIFLFANNASNEDSASNLSQNDSTSLAEQADGAPSPADSAFPTNVNIFGQPFVANIQTSDSADSSSNGTIKMTYNSQSLWSVDVSTPEGNLTTIYTSDASYVKSPDGWTKFPTGQGADFDVSSYGFNDDDVGDIGQYATRTGTESCSLGTCSVWQANDTEDGSNAKIWFGPSGRVAKMMVENGTSTTEVTYDYNANTSIDIPTDFQEFDIPDLENLDLDDYLPQ